MVHLLLTHLLSVPQGDLLSVSVDQKSAFFKTLSKGWLSHITGGEWGGVIIIKFCTRVHVCYVIISAIFCVDISRDVDSVRG